MSTLGWAFAAILVLITFSALRLVGGLILVSGVLTLWVIGMHLAQGLVTHAITEVIREMIPWPPHLTRVGQARTVFSDPISVDRSGMVLAGDFTPGFPDPSDRFQE